MSEAFNQPRWSDAAAARARRLSREIATQDQLVEQTGIPKATLQRILKGADPGPERLARLAQALQTTVDYLLNGESDASSVLMVNIYEVEVAAGHGREPLEGAPVDYWPLPRDWTREHFGERAMLRMVRVRGDSQMPELNDQDLVVIDKSQNRLGAGMHVVRLDDMLLIKRIQPEGRMVRLISNNKDYRDIEVDLQADADRFAIIGKAVWAMKLL